jgi:hypothetical protein
MNLIQQFLGGLAEVVPAPTGVSSESNFGMVLKTSAAAAPPVVRGQMLMPVTAWNWPDPVTGTVTNAQFRFADTVPQSVDNGALYQPSGRSFSLGYMSFLQVLETCRFPYPAMLANAMQKVATPAGNPVDSPTPAGWTKVDDTGYLQWKPIWTLPESSSQWQAAVAAGTIANPGTLRLNLKDTSGAAACLQALDTQGHALALPVASLDTVTITSECWGQMSIFPGSWYDASMVALGRSLVPDASAFFGPGGLIAGRISSFYVALRPRFDFTAAAPIPAALRQTLDDADTVQAMGVTVQRALGDGVPGQALRLENTDPAPVIVAVGLETLG